jgi:hypothetical protein
MDLIIKNLIGTAVRWLLTSVGAWLVAQGILQSGAQVEWVAGAVAIVTALVWGLYQKFVAAKLLKTAMELPAGATLIEVKAAAKNG